MLFSICNTFFLFSEVIPLSDGSNSSTGPPSKKVALSSEATGSDKPTAKAQVVDLTSDSEDELPLRRKVAKPADSTHVNVESSSSSHIKYNGITIFHIKPCDVINNLIFSI